MYNRGIAYHDGGTLAGTRSEQVLHLHFSSSTTSLGRIIIYSTLSILKSTRNVLAGLCRPGSPISAVPVQGGGRKNGALRIWIAKCHSYTDIRILHVNSEHFRALQRMRAPCSDVISLSCSLNCGSVLVLSDVISCFMVVPFTPTVRVPRSSIAFELQ